MTWAKFLTCRQQLIKYILFASCQLKIYYTNKTNVCKILLFVRAQYTQERVIHEEAKAIIIYVSINVLKENVDQHITTLSTIR